MISFKNSFDALKDQDDMFKTDKSDWQKSNNIESTVNDGDSEEVENVFVEDNGKPIDGLVDDARKKVEAPPKKTHRKTGRISRKWSMRMPIAKRVDDCRMVIGISCCDVELHLHLLHFNVFLV
ncbi:hypothetical protein Tco_1548635 [Tanacetum coccineum]